MEYDKNIMVGDIVKGYYKGYWQVLAIEVRGLYTNIDGTKIEQAPLVTGRIILENNGKISKRNKKEQWDMSYCKRITTKEVEEIIASAEVEFETLKTNLRKLIK